ncbi:MAG: hypothetical protein HY791_36645 [Deltaproteobacteria bacterium]|nr:hypothetical protein [Deltaproteobacteria bacterium]
MALRPWVLSALLFGCAESTTLSTSDARGQGAFDSSDSAIDVGDATDSDRTTNASDAGFAADAAALDAMERDAEPADAGECPPPPVTDFSCGSSESCPGGTCVFGLCIGPRLDPDRWLSCGDGVCDRCEVERCPADCGPAPAVEGAMGYDDGRTFTLWIHGFSNKSPEEMKHKVYGAEQGCPEILELAGPLLTAAPCGDTPGGSTDPTQWSSIEYYGGVPDTWLSPADVREIERHPWDGTRTLHRYALIVAKFIRHKLVQSGAEHVNVACHSMGCLVTRYVIENDIEGLATERRIVRWFTSAGVLGGARLAYLYNNPAIQDGADAIGLALSDFAVMNPDFVSDHAAVWDHRLHEANHPRMAGILIHHIGGTDPHIREALGIPLLDLNNPDDEPNDGIMFTSDEYFWSQAPEASATSTSGEHIAATHSYTHEYHMKVPDTDAAVVLAAASLFHRRKVFVTLEELELLEDGESHGPFDGQHGDPPAELSMEVRARFDPYVESRLGRSVIVHEDTVDHRTSTVLTQAAGSVSMPRQLLFAGPVFDEMTSLRLEADVVEVDWYPRFGVRESLLTQTQALGGFRGDVPLADGEHVFESAAVRGRIRVRMVSLY